MSTKKETELKLMKALVGLMRPVARYYKGYHGDADSCVKEHDKHPFGLDVPDQEVLSLDGVHVYFVGENATDMSVEAFLACLRHFAGFVDGERITKLRVISVPNGNIAEQNYVFFEFWREEYVFISGETTDFSGAGKAAKDELNGVFDVLAFAYGLEIERVQVDVDHIFLSKKLRLVTT